MKAILVIDLNDTTLNEWDTDTSKCWAEIKVYTPIKSGAHGIGCVYANNDVELRPMPEEKQIRNTDIAGAIDYGWNSCLAALEGKDMIDKLSDTLDDAIQTAKRILGETE